MEGGGGTEERVLRRREGAGVTEVVRNKDTRPNRRIKRYIPTCVLSVEAHPLSAVTRAVLPTAVSTAGAKRK